MENKSFFEKVIAFTALVCAIIALTISIIPAKKEASKQGAFNYSAPIERFASSTSFTVTNSDSRIVATSTRTYCQLSNLTPNTTIFLSFMGDQPSAANQGIALISTTTPYIISQSAGNQYYGAIRGISPNGNATMSYTCHNL